MKTLSQRLAKEVLFFHKHPNKRCTTTLGVCKYNGASVGKNTKGCLIGRMLPLKVRKKLDSFHPMNASDIRVYITGGVPDFILDVKNGQTLDKFQNLHDLGHNWDENGLSERGKEQLEYLIRMGSLKREDFKEVLE